MNFLSKERFVLPIVFLIIISCVLFGVSYSKDRYYEKPTLNILMLHMVTDKMPDDESLNSLYITDKMLREYCEYFKERYTIVSLDEAYDIIKNNKMVENPNLLAFTFDDGYDNNYTLAYPIFKELKIKANINIIAKYTDEGRSGYLTWEQIKEMADSGLISIGSHSYASHYYTYSIDGSYKPVLSIFLPGEDEIARRKRVFDDLRLADNMISNAIGKKVNILVYPYGVPPFDLMDEISKEFGYNMQVLVRPGANRGIDTFGKLERFTVDGTMKPEAMDSIIKRYNGLKFLEN